jgi:hypothetical protein
VDRAKLLTFNQKKAPRRRDLDLSFLIVPTQDCCEDKEIIVVHTKYLEQGLTCGNK